MVFFRNFKGIFEIQNQSAVGNAEVRTNEKIARLADLSLNTIVKVENGVNQNPIIETLTKIAKALEVGVDDLIK